MYELRPPLTDITEGGNDPYLAGPGYDLITGMGVPNQAFTDAWVEANTRGRSHLRSTAAKTEESSRAASRAVSMS